MKKCFQGKGSTEKNVSFHATFYTAKAADLSIVIIAIKIVLSAARARAESLLFQAKIKC